MPPEEDQPSSEMVFVQPNARAVSPLPAALDEPHAPSMACPKLSEALSLARDRCKMANKDKVNTFHKYAYASADEVILTAKEALAGTGLAIIPQAQELTIVGGGNLALYALNRTIFLSHSSGEFVPLTIRGWPVVPEKGRPLDKAFAVALTTSLSYLLRDLLQMPRGDDQDMNHRNDPQAQAAPEPRRASEPKPGPAPDEAAVLRQHAKAIEEAESLGQLEVAFTAAKKDKRLNLDQKMDLANLKNERKAALSAGKPNTNPDADGGGPEPAEGELFPHGQNVGAAK